MSADLFVDTNVLVYARDASEPDKQPVAERWIEALWQRRRGRLSVQVLSEYYVTVTRKLDPGLPPEEARSDLRDLATWRPIPLSWTAIEEALRLESRYALSWWDALIVATARLGGCKWLLTEDLQDGQDLDGVTVIDPFEHDLEAFLEG